MARAFSVFLAIAAAYVAAQAPAAQQALAPGSAPTAPETRKPILVDSLSGVTPTAAGPADHAPAVVTNGFESELTKLQSTIEAQKGTVDALTKQLEDGLRAKNRLMVAQKLMVAIISLKKAERVLGEVDAKIEDSKNNIKKFGEQADEITEGIKRSEVEHKKELGDLRKKLNTLRGDLMEQQTTLDSLVAKRAKISNTVARWKEHVATLRDAHESATQPEGVVKAHDGFDVPEPPSTIHTLSEFGLLPPTPPSAQMPNVDNVAGGKSTNYDAALREIAKRTFAELGKGRFAADMAEIEDSLQDALDTPRRDAGGPVHHAREDDDGDRASRDAGGPVHHAREDDDGDRATSRASRDAGGPVHHAREDDDGDRATSRASRDAGGPVHHAREDDDSFLEVPAPARNLRA